MVLASVSISVSRRDTHGVVHGILGNAMMGMLPTPGTCSLGRYVGGGWYGHGRGGDRIPRVCPFCGRDWRGSEDLCLRSMGGCLRWRHAVFWNPIREAEEVHAVVASLGWSVWRRRRVTECFLFPDDPVQSSPLENIRRQKPPVACRELVFRASPRCSQPRSACLMGSKHRLLRMGFVRMACPERCQRSAIGDLDW
jgi:hypothetical protein